MSWSYRELRFGGPTHCCSTAERRTALRSPPAQRSTEPRYRQRPPRPAPRRLRMRAAAPSLRTTLPGLHRAASPPPPPHAQVTLGLVVPPPRSPGRPRGARRLNERPLPDRACRCWAGSAALWTRGFTATFALGALSTSSAATVGGGGRLGGRRGSVPRRWAAAFAAPS